jgi:hypothetical protein
MIRSRTSLFSLAPLLLVLAAAGLSRRGGGGTVEELAPAFQDDATTDVDELDFSDPTSRILRGGHEALLGVGDCPSDVVLELWPPNHMYVEIDLADVLPPATVGIEILGITQDEPVDELGDGHTSCDGTGVGTSVARIRSERSGLNDGRVYVIEYSAFGGGCTGIVTVTVPHDQRGAEAVDSGQDFDSTEGCP